MLLGFHLGEAAAGQEQLGTSQHWWVQWSTPRLSSFPFCCPFKDWSNRELFGTVPSLSFFLPWCSLRDRTCWGCNQLPVAGWSSLGRRGVRRCRFCYYVYQNYCKIPLVLVWTGEKSLVLPDSGGTITKLGSSPFYSDDLLQILNQCWDKKGLMHFC